MVPFIRDITVYVGSDQGLYRGHLDLKGWSWTQAAGMPNVLVTDLKVHQSAQFFDLTRIVRASTFGRGIYELRKSRGPVLENVRMVQVRAMRAGEDGAPPELSVGLQAHISREKIARERGMKETPFELAPFPGTEVTLEAPREVADHDATLSFAGWVIDGTRANGQNRITLKLEDVSTVVANYLVKQVVPRPSGSAMKVSLSARARAVCVTGFSRELTLTWDVTGGQRPVSARAEITYPDKTGESSELKQINGAREIPVNFPGGGSVAIRVTAGDSAKGKAFAESTVSLRPCR